MAQIPSIDLRSLANLFQTEIRDKGETFVPKESAFAESLAVSKSPKVKEHVSNFRGYQESSPVKVRESAKVKDKDTSVNADPVAVGVNLTQETAASEPIDMTGQGSGSGKIVPTLLMHGADIKASQGDLAPEMLQTGEKMADPFGASPSPENNPGISLGQEAKQSHIQPPAAVVEELPQELAQAVTQDMAQNMAQQAVAKTQDLKPTTVMEGASLKAEGTQEMPLVSMERPDTQTQQDSHQETLGEGSRSQTHLAAMGPESKAGSFNLEENLTTGMGTIGGATNSAARAQLALQAGSLKPAAVPTVVDQLKVQIRQALETGLHTISVKLRPEHLGAVEVTLEVIDKHIKSLQIVADRPEALQALRENGQQLVKSLQDLGFNTSSGDLNFSLQGQDKNNQENQSGFSNGGTSPGALEAANDLSSESGALRAQEYLSLNATYSVRA